MRKFIGVPAALVCVMTAASGQQDRNARGIIRGVVFNERNERVSGATLEFQAVDDALHRVLPHCETDRDGGFVLNHVRWGTYKVFVSKEDDGYPSTRWNIYSGDVNPLVVVSATAPSVSISVSMGPQAGTVFPLVVDALTDRPIDETLIRTRIWRWPNDRTDWLSSTLSEKRNVFVPANTPVGIEIEAEGYLPYRHGEKIVLAPGETLKLNVKLRPAKH